MSPKKISKKRGTKSKNTSSFFSNKMKINLIDPVDVLLKTKGKIENYYANYQKNKEKEKIKSEKQRKLDEKREYQRQKKQDQKERLDKIKEEKRQIIEYKIIISAKIAGMKIPLKSKIIFTPDLKARASGVA